MAVEMYWRDEKVEVWKGDSLELVRGLADRRFDAVVTDPPYSSGGMFRSDRAQKTGSKYVLSKKNSRREYPEFEGDNRDQRGLLAWSGLWLTECWRVTRPGGCLLCFCDWRNIPVMSDAIQCGGWVWRGVVPWDKTEGARPQKGWFRAQAEYVLTATRGGIGREQSRNGPCLPGVFRENVDSANKLHMTGKPVRLMRSLMEVVRPGGEVLDPFAGSGTTALAAKETGRRCVTCDNSAENLALIPPRMARAKAREDAVQDGLALGV